MHSDPTDEGLCLLDCCWSAFVPRWWIQVLRPSFEKRCVKIQGTRTKMDARNRTSAARQRRGFRRHFCCRHCRFSNDHHSPRPSTPIFFCNSPEDHCLADNARSAFRRRDVAVYIGAREFFAVRLRASRVPQFSMLPGSKEVFSIRMAAFASRCICLSWRLAIATPLCS